MLGQEVRHATAVATRHLSLDGRYDHAAVLVEPLPRSHLSHFDCRMDARHGMDFMDRLEYQLFAMSNDMTRPTGRRRMISANTTVFPQPVGITASVEELDCQHSSIPLTADC